MRTVLVFLAILSGCDWGLHRMQQVPGCRTYTATDLFSDGKCAQQAPTGTVAYDPKPAQMPRVTRALLVRGEDRFARFCAPCHGILADGDSYVARAMTLRRPPSLVDAAARSLPDDRILTVIAQGYGMMPTYASAVPPADRFAILQFIRALQLRDQPLANLPPQLQQEAKAWLP